MHSGPIVWSERAPWSSSQQSRGATLRWLAVVFALSACLSALAIGLAAWQTDTAATLLG